MDKDIKGVQDNSFVSSNFLDTSLTSEPEGLAFVAVAKILIIFDFLPFENVGFSLILDCSFDAAPSDLDGSELELLLSFFSLDTDASIPFTSASGLSSSFS